MDVDSIHDWAPSNHEEVTILIEDCLAALSFPFVLRVLQEEALRRIYDYHNLLVSLMTSYGKTIIIHGSVLMLRLKHSSPKGIGLCIEPLDGIITNHTNDMNEGTFIILKKYPDDDEALALLESGKVLIIYTCPESLVKRENFLKRAVDLSLLLITFYDEAHDIIESGLSSDEVSGF